jgi:hypothetical protein
VTITAQRGFRRLDRRRVVLLVLTLMLSGRAMTLAFISDAGSGTVGDPPAAWLMPLVGDAVIGLSAFGVGYVIVRGRGVGAWATIVVWNVVGIWDALSAFIVHESVPWNEFFMIETFGASMFFAASAVHLVNLLLVTSVEARRYYMGAQSSG